MRRVKDYLEREKLDAMIVFNKSATFKYLLKGEYDHGMMILTRDKNILFLSPLYASKIPGFEVVQWHRFTEDFRQLLRREGIKRAGAEFSNLYLRQKQFLSKHMRVDDASEFLDTLRVSKTPEEVDRIKKACSITDSIYKELLDNFNFKTEREIVKFLKIKMLERDVEHSFEPIAASGANAAVAHHMAGGKLKRGFLVLDFGVKHQGYVSDMTRTVFLGSPTLQEVSIYDKLLGIEEDCIERAKAGVKAGEVYDHCVKEMGSDSKFFNHSLGHGIGIEIHEAPSLGPNSKQILKRGHVFTIEPGYYNAKAGVGIRIEDDISLGAKKEVLTRSPKELITLTFCD